MTAVSPVRIQFMYRRGARLFWTSQMGPMKPGIQNGYALTVFETEEQLSHTIQTTPYSELFSKAVWKVGTAETTDIRLKRMFGVKKPLNSPEEIWDRFYIPLTDRLSKYQGDTKSMEAGQCAFMRDILIKSYATNGKVAILMIPLILGFQGTANAIEHEMTEMIVKAGGTVHNNKSDQAKKEKAPSTNAKMNMPEVHPDKLLELTPELQKIGFELHPAWR